jgi:hypothetical protein
VGLRDLFASIGMKLGLGRALLRGGAPSMGTGRELRAMFLGLTPQDVGASPTAAYPKVFGVAMDWPIGEHIATVVSACDGTGSLYTTSTAAVIGGQGHPPTHQAALRFVAAAQPYFEAAAPATSSPYPPPNVVRFYLLGYDGLRVVEDAYDAIASGTARLSPLFGAAHGVVTEMRLMAESRR